MSMRAPSPRLRGAQHQLAPFVTVWPQPEVRVFGSDPPSAMGQTRVCRGRRDRRANARAPPSRKPIVRDKLKTDNGDCKKNKRDDQQAKRVREMKVIGGGFEAR